MTLAWIDENVTRKNDLDRLKPIIAELNEFLDPTPAVIQDEQKENSKNDEVVEAVDDDGKDDKQQENPVVVEAVDVDDGSVVVQGEQQQTSLFNNAMTNNV